MKISIVGGAGHVGLPLSILLAKKNPSWNIQIFDLNSDAVDTITRGKMPFSEPGAEKMLREVIGLNLKISDSIVSISDSDVIIVVIGTPVDGHLNPKYNSIRTFMETALDHLSDDQVILLRSTVYPGTTENIQHFLKGAGLNIHLGYCPERIAEGHALEELVALPQIISGLSEKALDACQKVFGSLTSTLVQLKPKEAELAKLFTNSWRYIQFATANQFYMLAEEDGIDFHRMYHAITHEYPRTVGFPKAGYAAGPCLVKDTIQLSAYASNHFFLGHAAMLANEGLPQFVVEQIKKKIPDLHNKVGGVLGMAFKAESDDPRDSLSYKLKNLLSFHVSKVICSDEYVPSEKQLTAEQLISQSDFIVVGAPHKRYRELLEKTDKPVFDVWNMLEPKEKECPTRLPLVA